jgi:hypothetical protein
LVSYFYGKHRLRLFANGVQRRILGPIKEEDSSARRQKRREEARTEIDG